MTDKVRKASVFLQALSRLPGLGFLADTERDLREAADQFDEVGDRVDEAERHYSDVSHAAGDVVSSDDEN
jgi:nitrate reductase assembly molybdenum cofactor insertion protein NarJ